MNPPEAITEQEFQEAKECVELRDQVWRNLTRAQAKDSRESAKAMLSPTKTCETLGYEIHPFQEIVEPAVPDEEEDDWWNAGEIYAMSAE